MACCLEPETTTSSTFCYHVVPQPTMFCSHLYVSTKSKYSASALILNLTCYLYTQKLCLLAREGCFRGYYRPPPPLHPPHIHTDKGKMKHFTSLYWLELGVAKRNRMEQEEETKSPAALALIKFIVVFIQTAHLYYVCVCTRVWFWEQSSSLVALKRPKWFLEHFPRRRNQKFTAEIDIILPSQQKKKNAELSPTLTFWQPGFPSVQNYNFHCLLFLKWNVNSSVSPERW